MCAMIYEVATNFQLDEDIIEFSFPIQTFRDYFSHTTAAPEVIPSIHFHQNTIG